MSEANGEDVVIVKMFLPIYWDSVNPHSRRGPVAVRFEDYVELDMRVLQETGMIQDWSLVDFETFLGSHQELEAWQTYLYTNWD
jgi:hypothetical protein